ncbi:MAG: hypothetical protein ACREEM_38380 [Blastocatellia bacterium]
MDQTLDLKPQAGGGFRRVLTLGDLVIFGIAFVGPTAPYSMFGIASVKSQGHLPLVYLIAMIAMSSAIPGLENLASIVCSEDAR